MGSTLQLRGTCLRDLLTDCKRAAVDWSPAGARVLLVALLLPWLIVETLAQAPLPSPRFVVSPTGDDGAAGSAVAPFRTIQHAIDLAQPGDEIAVQAGRYSEVPKTVRAGTLESRISVHAVGGVFIPGFRMLHSYFELSGFQLDGDSTGVFGNQGVITIGRAVVGGRVENCQITNWKSGVYGIWFEESGGQSPSNCTIRNNKLSNAGFHMLNLNGRNTLVERNTFDTSNGWDALRIFGADHRIRANYFTHIDEKAGNGNHTDIFQGFDDSGSISHDILFEHNFVYDSFCQMGQINNDRLSTAVYAWTIRGNVFAKMNLGYNLNASVRGIGFEHNTVVLTGSLVLGQVSDGSVVRSNAFVGNVGNSGSSGWYLSPIGVTAPSHYTAWTASLLDCKTLGLTDAECSEARKAEANQLLLELQASGFLSVPNANKEYPVLESVNAVTTAAGLGLSPRYAAFSENVLKTLRLVYRAARTFEASNNFVAGPPPNYLAKNASCTKLYRPFNFCETAGVNGGDPSFWAIDSPLGADSLPFTADDGLRPLATSRLCAGGTGGSSIGAYPCSGDLEPAGAADGPLPPEIKLPLFPNSLKVGPSE